MKRAYPWLFLLFLSPSSLPAQDVGQGAPSGLESLFQNAFFRNRFNTLVSLPPVGAVRRLGAGYVQEFQDVNRREANVFALVRGDTLTDVFQMYPGIYAQFGSVGVATAGFPTMDTAPCISGTAGTVCTYQIFTKTHALFAYTSSAVTAAGQGVTVQGNFYTTWTTKGGISSLGPATTGETAITSATGVTATGQQFYNGSIYTLSSGNLSGRTFTVTGKVFALYKELGLHTGSLGLPLGDELNAGNGRIRQAFEGGSVEYTATTDAVVRPSVGSVSLSVGVAEVLRMNLGDTLPIRAVVTATVGGELTDREVTWVTTNGRVVAIQPNGLGATLRAVGGGAVQISAVSEGKVSPALNIFVAAPCCQIGEGAPTLAIQQAFQDAASRNRLSVQLPVAAPVKRVGLGLVQELRATDGVTRYLLCRSDVSPGVFVVTGALLAAYEVSGGPGGALGYPISDPTAGGRQMFEGGALAGQPIYAVSGAILTRWEALGFENGALGAPAGAAASINSFTGSSGTGQSFANGLVIRIATGKFAANRGIVTTGAFLLEYLERGGAQGNLGFPVSESYMGPQGLPTQDFEGGQMRLRDGAVEVVERERTPEITVTPSRVSAGSRVRVIVGGFAPGTTLRISSPSDPATPAFEIPTMQGSYSWEAPIASTARSGIVTLLAVDANGTQRANGSYTVVALAEANVQLNKVRGDTQTGLPGARLPQALLIAAVDGQGAPLVGIPIRFAASPGASVAPVDAITNERGEASTTVRLQPNEGVALVTATGAGKVATFSARAAPSTLTNFPRQAAPDGKGALLASASSILRYHQNRNELPTSQGLADPAALGTFLRTFCVLDTAGGRICDGFLPLAGTSDSFVNLWRLKEFAGGTLDVEAAGADPNTILDLLAVGSPVLVALNLSVGETPVGSHFVAAIGVSADGAIVIHDTASPARPRLDDYLAGFTLAGRQVQGKVADVLRLVPRSPSPSGFLVEAGMDISVRSVAGDCGRELVWLGPAVITASGVQPANGSTHLYYCNGLEPEQIVRFSPARAFVATLTDLGAPGRRTELIGGTDATWLATRAGGQWVTSPVDLEIDAASVVNAATFTNEVAAGSLVTIAGLGFGADTVVEVNGVPAIVAGISDFRLNIEIPPALLPGEYLMTIAAGATRREVPVTLQESAPAIFRDSANGNQPLVTNTTGGQRNTAANPVSRGGSLQIYATGLGEIRVTGNSEVVTHPIEVVLQGQALPASSAVRLPQLPGIYLVTVNVPARVAPGLDVPLRLRQSGVESNAVPVSIR
ncbi:MAG: hypothetical protein JNK87_16010 [Bryobacterales bacterium]|nr:hypothetical protein [Bryobacterales bacterium]